MGPWWPRRSHEGSRISFMTESDGQIYMRENGERTIWVSRHSEQSRILRAPRSHFLAASADGSVVASLLKRN